VVVGSLLYPVLVYFGLSRVSSQPIVAIAVGLIVLRVTLVSGDTDRTLEKHWLLASAVILAGLLVVEPTLAAKAYPVVISLTLAVAFAWSLRHPPTLVERMARLTDPELPARAIPYTRAVTWLWTIFLMINTLLATALAIWGSLEAWVLWTGLLSYVAIGLLFGIEWLVRQHVRRSWLRSATS
jgi:uncharacterized membrane protein